MIAIRQACLEDAEILLSLIDALADYEKLDRPTADARERLTRDAFQTTPPRFNAVLAEWDGRPVGYSIFFETYSTFLAQPTLYAEDIFVVPDARRHGIGDALFRFLIGEARRRGCGRMEWTCLNWNQLAIGFYEKRGAQNLDEWRMYRLTKAEMNVLIGTGDEQP